MRIAFVTIGLVRYTSLLANALVASEQVAFVGLDFRQEVSEEESFSDMVRRLFKPEVDICLPSRWRKRDPRNLLAVSRAIRFLRQWQPDVIHIQTDYDYRVYMLLQACRHIPYVDTIHDVEPHLGEKDRYEKKLDWPLRHWVRRHASKIIVHGQTIKNMLVQQTGYLSAQAIAIIPIPAFKLYERWKKAVIDSCSNKVLFFGRIWPYKGLDILIRAEPIVSAVVPDVKFIIAGTGEDIGRYQAMMIHPGRFEIHNRYLTDEEVVGLFERAAMVALPYREASQSGVVAVAYTMGKPVVVSRVGSLTEIVKDGETGLVVPPEDPEALARAIILLLRNPKLRQRMGQAALEIAQHELAPSTIVAQTMKVYKSILRRRMTLN